MKAGLSKLQKHVLRLAYQNKLLNRGAPDLTNRDVLRHYYGFPIRNDVVVTIPHSPLFSRKEIGFKKYNSCSAATAKCFSRLVERGLADRIYGFGINLTDEGVEIAKSLDGKRKRGRWRKIHKP